MTRELIVLNIMNNYGKYGIAKETITQLIDSGLKDGLNCDAIYLGLSMAMESIYMGNQMIKNTTLLRTLQRHYVFQSKRLRKLLMKESKN